MRLKVSDIVKRHIFYLFKGDLGILKKVLKFSKLSPELILFSEIFNISISTKKIFKQDIDYILFLFSYEFNALSDYSVLLVFKHIPPICLCNTDDIDKAIEYFEKTTALFNSPQRMQVLEKNNLRPITWGEIKKTSEIKEQLKQDAQW